MELFEILFLFLMAHLIGDYVIQSRFIAESKGDIEYHLFIHIALLTFSFYLAMLILGSINWWILLAIFITHYAIDKWKCVMHKKNKDKIMKYYLIDQILHYIMIIILSVIYWVV